MNADPADTRLPHLDLGDLIAGAAGQPVGDRARAHLAGCGHCQREADRWNLVAGAVRGLAAAAPDSAAAPGSAAAPDSAAAPGSAAGPDAARPARPRRTGPRVLAGPWRRVMLVAGSAAAALVLLAGAGAVTGYVHVHVDLPGHRRPGGPDRGDRVLPAGAGRRDAGAGDTAAAWSSRRPAASR